VSTKNEELKLGDRVTITGTVEKARGNDSFTWGSVRYRDAKVPGFVSAARNELGAWHETFTPHPDGVIVGKRRYTSMENDEGIWIPDGVQEFTAYLVAYHLSRKPVIVRADQMEAAK